MKHLLLGSLLFILGLFADEIIAIAFFGGIYLAWGELPIYLIPLIIAGNIVFLIWGGILIGHGIGGHTRFKQFQAMTKPIIDHPLMSTIGIIVIAFAVSLVIIMNIPSFTTT